MQLVKMSSDYPGFCHQLSETYSCESERISLGGSGLSQKPLERMHIKPPKFLVKFGLVSLSGRDSLLLMGHNFVKKKKQCPFYRGRNQKKVHLQSQLGKN